MICRLQGEINRWVNKIETVDLHHWGGWASNLVARFLQWCLFSAIWVYFCTFYNGFSCSKDCFWWGIVSEWMGDLYSLHSTVQNCVSKESCCKEGMRSEWVRFLVRLSGVREPWIITLDVGKLTLHSSSV